MPKTKMTKIQESPPEKPDEDSFSNEVAISSNPPTGETHDSDAENEEAVAFLTMICNGETEETIHEKFENVRTRDLMSALHWVGIKLTERHNLLEHLKALEDAETLQRRDFEKMLEAEKKHAYLTRDEVREIMTGKVKSTIRVITGCDVSTKGAVEALGKGRKAHSVLTLEQRSSKELRMVEL